MKRCDVPSARDDGCGIYSVLTDSIVGHGRKSRKFDNQGKRDLIAEPVEIRGTSGGLLKS
jgi:hypothetical protein